MFVGVLELTLLLPYAPSLKAKRSVVRSVIERVRARFKVSVAEVGANDVHQRAVVGVSTVGNDSALVHTVLNQVTDAVASHAAGEAELVDIRVEVMNVSFEYQR